MDKDKQIICPVCGTAIPSDAKICPHCKETLWSDEVPEEFGGGSATETSDGTPPPMLGEIYNRDFRPDPDMEPEAETERLLKIRGWLFLFVFMMWLSIVRAIVSMLTESLPTPFLLSNIAKVGLVIYALVCISRVGSNVVFLCKSLLLITLVETTCMMFGSIQLFKYYSPDVILFVVKIVVSILWLGYFNSSAQVERLFPTEERSHSTVDVVIVAITAILALVASYTILSELQHVLI